MVQLDRERMIMVGASEPPNVCTELMAECNTIASDDMFSLWDETKVGKARTIDLPRQASKVHQASYSSSSFKSHNNWKSLHRDYYELGDTVRSPHHMAVEPTRSKATQAVDTLSKHEFAFVKRSSGSYIYAMLAYRTKGPTFSSLKISQGPVEEVVEETMTFLLSKDGCTKVFKKSQWGDYVRLVSDFADSNNASEKSMPATPPAISHEQVKACDTKEGAPARSRSSQYEKYNDKYIRHWEQVTLSHFQTSSWEDVVQAGLKVLQVPSQTETNFTILFEVGYAYLRLEEYECSANYFAAAQHIDSECVSLKLAIGDLRRKVRTGPWLRRR